MKPYSPRVRTGFSRFSGLIMLGSSYVAQQAILTHHTMKSPIRLENVVVVNSRLSDLMFHVTKRHHNYSINK